MESKDTVEERWVVGKADRDAAMAALFDAEYPRLRGLAYVLTGDEHAAEEIAMETFVKAFSSWTRVTNLDWPAGYLRRILLNVCRSKARRQRIEHRVNRLFESGRSGETQGWDAPRSDVRLDVWDAVRRLPDRQRACIVLRYVENMTDAEIAYALECSVGSVKTHHHRARRALLDSLGPTQEGNRNDA